MYDWANSAYSVIVAAAILPIYFGSITEMAGVSAVNSNAYWGYANSLAGLLVAVLSPILGTYSDYKGFRSIFFRFFLCFGVIATALLSFTMNWKLLLLFYGLSVIGFNGANIFYDSFLSDVTTMDRIDQVSSWGFGMGYIGGSTIPFLVSIALVQFGENWGIPVITATKISFIITAVWWALFSIPMLRNVRQRAGIPRETGAVRKTFSRLGKTFKEVTKNKNMLIFLIGYFFYIDGVGTIIKMAAKYGDSLGLGTTHVIIALLITQVVAFPCAIWFGMLARKVGSKNMILCGIGVYLAVCLVGFTMTKAWQFYLLATLVGTSQGGIQALSRSFFGKLIPDKNRSGEFYGLYNIFGKFESVMGTALMGIVTQLTGKINYGVLSVIVTFLIGGGLLLLVKDPAKAQKAGAQD